MVIDSSALVAILFGEEETDSFVNSIAEAEPRLVSAANLLEAAIVVDNLIGPAAGRQLDRFVEQAKIRIEPVTEEQIRLARQAYLDFGRGNRPAKLNFGDCFAYALAKATGEPVLFKGGPDRHQGVSISRKLTDRSRTVKRRYSTSRCRRSVPRTAP
jgi:ribonuclease VapC